MCSLMNTMKMSPLSIPYFSSVICRDPHVERLLQAFAFLAAHVQLKIDDDFPEIVERVLAAATQKDYRFLHAGKEIRLNNEVHGTHVASEASSPLVQELGGPVSLRL